MLSRWIDGAGRSAALWLLLVSPGLADGTPPFRARGRTVDVSAISDGALAAAVERAGRGARRRLGAAECLAVLEEFHDAARRPLRDVAASLGGTPDAILARAIFRDGREAAICRAGTVAFTGVGSRVVFLCGARFMRLDRTAAELVIIHETLHTLGLGERPPSSRDIDRQVARRCGP
jgi:hypothetical protein